MDSIKKKLTLSHKKRACEWYASKRNQEIVGRSKMKSKDWDEFINYYKINVWEEIDDQIRHEKNKDAIRLEKKKDAKTKQGINELLDHLKKIRQDYENLDDTIKVKIEEYKNIWEVNEKAKLCKFLNITNKFVEDRIQNLMCDSLFHTMKWLTMEQKDELKKLGNFPY
jgi:hypothetical protein